MYQTPICYYLFKCAVLDQTVFSICLGTSMSLPVFLSMNTKTRIGGDSFGFWVLRILVLDVALGGKG